MTSLLKYIWKKVIGLAAFIGITAGISVSIATNAWGSVTISPVLLELSPEGPITSVTLTNDNVRPLTIQAETLSWHQEEGENIYDVTDDLIVSPVIVQIPPGGKQIFRVTLRKTSLMSSTKELAYRLVLEDISNQVENSAGVFFKINHSLPLFVLPESGQKQSTLWQSCPSETPAAPACIELINTGVNRIRLSQLTFSGENWQQSISGGHTLLPGSSKKWRLNEARSAPKEVSGRTEQGVFDIELPPPSG